MPATHDLVRYLDELLDAPRFRDYCPNGLQVEGRPAIKTLLTGVTASATLIERAIAENADALLVHHGYFWKGENAAITGIKRERLKRLLGHDLNLIVYHLPLDAHPEFGNNVQLARVLDLQVEEPFGAPDGPPIIFRGQPAAPMAGEDFARFVAERLQRPPLHIPGSARMIRSIAWCTGAAQNYLELAAAAGVDAYLSGEISEQTVHAAREAGIHYFAAGHHATERYGVRALGEHLAGKFGLKHRFVDIDNPA
jgi:dinuclear metal center YbgI/SA1388 family protein